MHLVKMNILGKFLGSRKFLFRFSRKSYNHIRCNGRIFKSRSQIFAALPIFVRRVVAVHPFENGIASALKGKMKMRTDLRISR